MFACTVGGNSELLKLSHKLLRPLSAPVLLMARPTTVPTTKPSTKQPNPPVTTVIPVAATTAAVANAVIAMLAATSSTPPRMSAIIEVWFSASPRRAAQSASDMRDVHPTQGSGCRVIVALVAQFNAFHCIFLLVGYGVLISAILRRLISFGVLRHIIAVGFRAGIKSETGVMASKTACPCSLIVVIYCLNICRLLSHPSSLENGPNHDALSPSRSRSRYT
ncbi:hypothetical protein PS676_05710 [Pseudomonas fluorescens]|nr:hypothetical protein PS676_05710 [Pseudomonas fluorescens]